MIIGIDFDNTIVCYDGIFHRVALERGLIPADLPQDKTTVRDYLRQTGREPDWTEMQGLVYGPRLIDALPYPGVLDFFHEVVHKGIEVRIISHKTKRPFLGEPHDLHAAAWGWLAANGFFDPARIGMRRDQVFLELTKESKHQRISTAGCTHFIDDLPEFLLDPGFPQGVERIHFDPCASAHPDCQLHAVQNWRQIASELLPQPRVIEFAQQALGIDHPKLTPVTGGANNRLFSITNSGLPTIIKVYHQSDSDKRDRFAAEQRFYHLNLPSTPGPLAWDDDKRLAAFRFISGRKLAADEVTETDVLQSIEWICAVQDRRIVPAATDVALAADACLSIEDHVRLAERRVERLQQVGSDHAEFSAFVSEALAPHIEDLAAHVREQAGAELDTLLPMKQRILSPSDFGFHNALKDEAGRLWFFDFEYAGWDDPAKLVCDYFCQPQVPVSMEYADHFLKKVADITCDDALQHRFQMLLPLHAAKWACILLNEFITTDFQRRQFAGLPDRRAAQLEKADHMLAVSISHSPAF